MKVIAALAAFVANAHAFTAPAAGCTASARSNVRMETQADLKALATQQNPVIGFFDPCNLSQQDLWDQGNEATIGWIRQAEIKHGRIAMAGFVGYCAHANGIHFPWTTPGYEPGLTPPELWDNLPMAAKLQIVVFVGFLEFWSENAYVLEGDGTTHYMRGGKPGYFPSFKMLPHPVPFNLYDPFGFSKNRDEAAKAKGLIAEVNNGRLAMIGLFGFLAEAKVPGSVPFLSGVIPPYAGDFMVPFATGA